MSLRELEKLTNAERLVIWRRRKGLNQKEAARDFDVSLDLYSQWERGMQTAPKMNVGRLEVHEVCFLYRRRAGKKQVDIANDLGMCRYWVNQMERGEAPVQDLISYWEC